MVRVSSESVARVRPPIADRYLTTSTYTTYSTNLCLHDIFGSLWSSVYFPHVSCRFTATRLGRTSLTHPNSYRIFIDLIRRNAFTSRIWVEFTWITIFWIMELCTSSPPVTVILEAPGLVFIHRDMVSNHTLLPSQPALQLCRRLCLATTADGVQVRDGTCHPSTWNTHTSSGSQQAGLRGKYAFLVKSYSPSRGLSH